MLCVLMEKDDTKSGKSPWVPQPQCYRIYLNYDYCYYGITNDYGSTILYTILLKKRKKKDEEEETDSSEYHYTNDWEMIIKLT